MQLFRRISLFLLTNILVVLTISLILSFFNVRPFLNKYGIDYPSLMIFCFVWGFVGAIISLLLSKVMAKWTLGVQIISRDARPEYRFLVDTVEKLAKDAGMAHVPEVGIFASPAPNAFATGPSQRHSLVAVSSGLLQHLNQSEISAVIGHELSHIQSGDMVTMTLLQGVVNAFVMFLSRALAFAFSGLSRSRDEGGRGSYGMYYLFVFLFEVIFMIIGSMVVAGFSRYREYRADEGGARLTSKLQMINALRSLERSHLQVSVPQSVQALMIKNGAKSGLLSLFATHPPIEKRIAHLESVSIR